MSIDINALNVTIPRLHDLYCKLTGYRVQFTMAHRYRWETWIAYRPHEPFNEEDLKAVILFIQDQIAQGRRRQQSLHILNLIEDCERFELDLQDARGRVHRVAHVSAKDRALMATGRPAEDKGHQAQSAQEIIEQHKLAKNCWAEWKKNNPLYQ